MTVMNRGLKKVETLQLRVKETVDLTGQIRKIVLEHVDGLPLPAATPGAHVRVHIKGAADDSRAYSLLLLNGNAGDATHLQYEIAVKREDAGSGGSRYMHTLKVGDTLVSDIPRNDFMLDPADRASPVLLAGGIGITPIFAMAGSLRREGRHFHLHYAGRDRAQMALVDELESFAGDNLQLHLDQQDSQLDIQVIVQSMQADQHLYVCGPAGLLDAVLAMTKQQGIPAGRVHFELFNNPAARADAGSFQVRLAQSGKTYEIPPDKSILEVLQEQGEDPLCDCCRGECGVCQVGVLEGEPDHRDYVLSDAEKAEGKLMQICVSRSKSAVLVLDL